METLGQPDVAVNIAGIKGEQDWENIYDINLVKIFEAFSNLLY